MRRPSDGRGSGIDMRPPFLPVVAMSAAALLAGCVLGAGLIGDFGAEVVAVNESTQNVAVQVDYMYLSTTERTYFVPVPAGTSQVVHVWGHPSAGPMLMIVMDSACRPVREHEGSGTDGTTIRIGPDDSVTFDDDSGPDWTGPRPESNEGLGFPTCTEAFTNMTERPTG